MSYDTTSALDQILDRGALRIPVEFNDTDSGFPPEMYIDAETGEPSGIAPIIGGLIAKDLQVALECIDMPWPEHLPAVLKGDVDLLPKHTLNPRRALEVDFADGRLTQLRITCLVPAGSDFGDPAQLDDAGIVISHWHGSSIAGLVTERFPKASILESPNPALEVKEGRANVCVTDSVTHRLLEVNPDLQLMRDAEGRLVVLSREYNKLSIRPGDERFLNWLNSWYDYHHAQGTIQYWCEQWWESFMADGEG